MLLANDRWNCASCAVLEFASGDDKYGAWVIGFTIILHLFFSDCSKFLRVI
ncbi:MULTISPECIES: hypothetical protein [unclassified Paenibacillus]|uniref:hypothetical protein n=1 Tax=unclassified Paenibacillus TaxID=185978 RepID=UPI00362F2643